MLKYFFLLLFTASASLQNLAWSQDNFETFEKIIDETFRNNRGSKVLMIPDIDLSGLNALKVLQILRKYDSETSANSKFILQTLYFKIGLTSTDLQVRQEVTYKLVRDCADSLALTNQQAIKKLLSFSAEDFSSAAKNKIVAIHQSNKVKRMALVVGVSQLTEEIPTLKRNTAGFDTSKNGWYETRPWYATLALARIGDKIEINKAIQLVDRESNKILQVTRLLEDVAYIRQPEAIKLLEKFLNSRDRLPSVNDKGLGVPVSQYALSFLTRMLKDFPVSYNGINYSETDLQVAKQWLSNRNSYIIIR